MLRKNLINVSRGSWNKEVIMKLKRIAVLALIFTTITGINAEPVTAVTNATATEVQVQEPDSPEVYTNTEADTSLPIENTGSTVSTETVSGTNNGDTANKNSKVKSKAKKTSKKKKAKAKNKYTKSELRLMSSIINCEAGIEPYQGKLAVGIVVMNRIRSKRFPNTLKGVIYQRGQFSPVRNGSLRKRLSEYDSGKIRSKQWKSCISAAKKVLNGQRTISYRGKAKNMNSYYYFSVGLRGARLRLGGHKFK